MTDAEVWPPSQQSESESAFLQVQFAWVIPRHIWVWEDWLRLPWFSSHTYDWYFSVSIIDFFTLYNININVSQIFYSVILNTVCMWGSLRSFKMYWYLCPIHRSFDLVHLGCGPGIGLFKAFSGHSTEQLQLRTSAPVSEEQRLFSLPLVKDTSRAHHFKYHHHLFPKN